MNRLKTTFMTVLTLIITVGFLWYTNRSVTPKTATHEDVVAEARAGGYQLINTNELKAVYDKHPEGLLLIDTRQDWEYRSGHIRGALNFPMEPTWLSRWKNKEALEKFLGPDRNRLIVFY